MEALEEKLREAACLGDLETVEKLTKQDININSKQKANGWTALHWACKKGHEDITKLLLSRGADPTIVNDNNETPADVCSSPSVFNSFMNGISLANNHLCEFKLRTNILRNSNQTDPTLSRIKHSNITYMPSTMLPSIVPDEGSTMLSYKLFGFSHKCYNFIVLRKCSITSNIKKTVFVSSSKDIFTNLALENWLYKNYDFKNHHALLMWQSDPCVVIGRHQNPFIEANIAELKNITKCGVSLARRDSGGGAVFHDNGNLNLSFLSTHECYNRKHNLEIISRALLKECGLNIEINKREDLVLDGCKVSGTASKLGRPNAYHHCTLLINANKNDLSRSLKKMNLSIETNATQSVRSKIMNLSEKISGICIGNLIKTIGIEYMRTPAFRGKNKPANFNIPQGFKYINPSEDEFPGLNEIQEHFSSWKWIYGKTPKFVVKYAVPLPDLDNSGEECTAILTVENGVICKIEFELPEVLKGLDVDENVNSLLKKSEFGLETFVVLQKIINNALNNQVSIIV